MAAQDTTIAPTPKEGDEQKNTILPTPKGKPVEETKDDSLQQLQDELTAQRERNDALEERMNILFKSVDKNKIRSNTPKEDLPPKISVTMYDGSLVLKWDKMKQNSVVVTKDGLVATQSSTYYLADDRTVVMDYADFHSNATRVDVEVNRVEPIFDKTGKRILDRIYYFTYEDEDYAIHETFIN